MIVSVGSWRGTGATTAALLCAVAAADEQPVWLIEADPAGGVLAGRLTIEGELVGGLEQLSFGPEQAAAVDMFDVVAHHRGDLRIVTAPADPFRAHACHLPRVQWMSMLEQLPGLVVLDIGRLRAGSPVVDLVRRSHRFVLVTVPEVSALVASAEWLACAGRVSPGDAGIVGPEMRIAVVDAPGSVGFARDVLERELSSQWGGWLPWEPTTVDLVHRGAGADDRRLRRSPLMAVVAVLGEEREVVSC